MILRQSALTVIAPVKPDEVAALKDLLDELGKHDEQSTTRHPPSFADLSVVHFACWQVINNDPRYPPVLSFEVNYDGDLETLLDDLVSGLETELNAVYGHCRGYPPPEARQPAEIKDYLRAHAVPTVAFYAGCPGQSLASIRNAVAVRQEVEGFLDSAEGRKLAERMSALQLHEQIKQQLARTESVKPLVSPVTLDAQRRRAWRNLILILLVALPTLVILSPLLLLWFIRLRMHEIRDARQPLPPPQPIDPKLFQQEDIYTQKHLTTLVNVKPGKFRLHTLKVVLWLVGLLARTFFTTGQLGGIPTIHFARWLFIDNDQRLLFFSNYDGSWASYLGDFVDRAAIGLTAIWGNTVDFPPARYLVFGGARDIEDFKQWSREHNIFAPVWYSAYPEETLWNLRKDIQFRDTVGKQLNEAQAAALLQLL
jgi:hypothetical protein